MTILLPSPRISSLVGRELPGRVSPGVGRGNSRMIVCSGVKSLEKASTKLPVDNDDDLAVRWLYGLVKESEAAAPSQTIEVKEEERRRREYYVNTGYAIRTIREEFPELFNRDLSYDIYREDIVFKDPMNTFSGIENYKSIFWALRFYGKIFFKAIWVDIISVWQPEENMILVRWTVHGVPWIPLGESRSRFDGTSEYKLDRHGKIYEHRVHNISLTGPQKYQILSVNQLLQAVGCPSTPTPTYFQLPSSSVNRTIDPSALRCEGEG